MKKYLIILCAIFTLTLSGCGIKTGNRAGAVIDENDVGIPLNGMERAYKYTDDQPSGDPGPTLAQVPVGEHDDDESETFEDGNRRLALRSNRLSYLVESMTGVEDAAVIINGDSAVVGVTFTGEPDSDEVKSLKKAIELKILNFDGELKRVAVTASPELYQRILNVDKSKRYDGNSQDRRKMNITPSF